MRSQYRKHLAKQKTKSGQAAAKITKWKFQDHMLFLNEFINQDRPRLTSIDENSDEEDSCKEINAEKDSQEHSETATSFENNDNDIEDYESQSNSKKISSYKKKQKPHNAVQETASTTLMKYLIEKKDTEKENKAHHPIEDFFSLMAASVKNFSPVDQHYVKSKVFAIVNDIEAKYLMQPPTYFTSSPQQSPTNFMPSSQQSPAQFTSSPQQSPAHLTPSPTQHNAFEYQ